MEVLVPQSCPTLFDPTDCSPPGSSVHGILQARMPECVAISFSRARKISSTTNLAVWEKALNMQRRKPHHQGEAWRPQSMITTHARTEQGENCRTVFSCPFPWGPPFLGEIASFSARASVTKLSPPPGHHNSPAY